MINESLLNKYKSIKFVPDGTIFGADMRVATQQKKCPFCFCALYEMRNKPLLYCRKKNCPKKITGKGFVISKEKILNE